MTATELLAALKAATGPSRELDARVALVTKAPIPYTADDDGCMVQMMQDVPSYTASLDAGRTLLLPGWEYMIFSPEKRVEVWAKLGDDDTYDVIAAETAKTVENAFAMAAIRARGEG